MRRARWCDLIGRDAGIGAVAPDCIGEALSGDCRTVSPWFDGLHLLGTHSTHRTACNPPPWQSLPWLRALVDRMGGHRPG